MLDFSEVLIVNEKTSMLQRLGFSEAILTPQHSHILSRRGARFVAEKSPQKANDFGEVKPQQNIKRHL